MFSFLRKKQLPFETSFLGEKNLASPLIEMAIEESAYLSNLVKDPRPEHNLKVRLELIIALYSIITFFFDEITKRESSVILRLYFSDATAKDVSPILMRDIKSEFYNYNNFCTQRLDYYQREIIALIDNPNLLPSNISVTIFGRPLENVPYSLHGTAHMTQEDYLKKCDVELVLRLKLHLMNTSQKIYLTLKSKYKN